MAIRYQVNTEYQLGIVLALAIATARPLLSQSPVPWQRTANTKLRMPTRLADVTTHPLPLTLAETAAFRDLIKLTPCRLFSLDWPIVPLKCN